MIDDNGMVEENATNIIGYARVSTREQDPHSQVTALNNAGASRIFVDHGASSKIVARPDWIECFNFLRAGDTLVVWALDRLAGTEIMAIEIIRELEGKGVHLRSLTEPEIDTTTPMGRALWGIVAVFAQLRVDNIRENTMRGLERARAEGRLGGRPSVLDDEKLAVAQELRGSGKSLREIGRLLGVSASTVSRYTQRN